MLSTDVKDWLLLLNRKGVGSIPTGSTTWDLGVMVAR